MNLSVNHREATGIGLCSEIWERALADEWSGDDEENIHMEGLRGRRTPEIGEYGH